MQRQTYGLGTYRLYPSGPFNCSFMLRGKALCEDGKVRAVEASHDGIADTFFSVPASVKVWLTRLVELPVGSGHFIRGKSVSVSGYVTLECESGSSVYVDDSDPLVLKFRAYTYGKNGSVFEQLRKAENNG